MRTTQRCLSKIVLISSGIYDYAEVMLDQPIHLVAPNNRGKTTLIAAIQFLFIDKLSHMHFSHSPPETREYYFQSTKSFILFECKTPTGYQIFLLRGLGPTRGYKYERYIYTGMYDKKQFIKNKRIRDWNHIRPELIEQNLSGPLKAKDVRGLLLGRKKKGRDPFGLVPVTNTEQYKQFRFLFNNLLKLSKIRQKGLRKLFVDISKIELSKERIDLRKEYSEMHDKIIHISEELEDLKDVRDDISNLYQHAIKRDTYRKGLLLLWRNIEEALKDEKTDHDERKQELEERIEELEAKKDKLELLIKKVAKERDQAIEKRKEIEGELRELEKLENEVSGYGRIELSSEICELRQVEEELTYRIRRIKREPLKDILREITSKKKKVKSNKKNLESFNDLFASYLRRDTDLSEEEINDLFRILNPAFLELQVPGEDGHIENPAEFHAFLKTLLKCYNEDILKGPGISIEAGKLDERDWLDEYENAEIIRRKIDRLQEKLQQLVQIKKDAQQKEKLQRERKVLRERLKSVERKMERLQEWGRRKDELPAKKEKWAAANKDIKDIKEKQEKIRDRSEELGNELMQVKRRKGDEMKRFAKIQNIVHSLEPPKSDWKLLFSESSSPFDGDIQGMVDEYSKKMRKHGRSATKVSNLLDKIESKTASRYSGINEAETIKNLIKQKRIIEKKEKVVKEHWKSLIVSLRSSMKRMLEGVKTIRRNISSLNSRLSERQISDLHEVKVEFREEESINQDLRKIIEAEGLFAYSIDRRERSESYRRISRLLDNHPIIDIAELFDVSFSIKDATGKKRTYGKLDRIESQGTSTTIKVLVHVELMHGLLTRSDILLPLYLDEVSVLDEDNLRAIIDHAEEMNFVPIIASPEASGCVNAWYFYRDRGKGREYIDERSRYDRRNIRDAD